MTAVLGRTWRSFRRFPGWGQALIVVAAIAAVSVPFDDGDDRSVVTRGAAGTTQASRRPALGEPPTTSVAQSRTSGASTVAPASVPAGGEDTTVERIIDGDTLVVAGGTRIRLIGIDTPETVDPGSPVQCFGPEATRYAKEMLPVGARIRLIYDVERLDRYGRTLAYVYKLDDGVFVNLALARNGFAQQSTFPPNVAHVEEFRRAVAQAREANLGLWGACQATSPSPTAPTVASPPPPTAAPTTRLTIVPSTAVTPVGGCHPSYEGACVPAGVRDVNCPQISATNIRVVGPDVYRLDADKDGIGCESR